MRIAFLIALALITSTVGGDEEYRLEVYYSMTEQTVCAHFKFDNITSCNATKLWYEEHTAWHNKNTYRCIPKSQCPAGTK